jgi:hypothetical protein
MRRLRRFLVILAVFSLVAACQPTFRSSGLPVTSKPDDNKVVLMPLDVMLSELSAGGIKEPNAVWTEQAKRNLKEGIRQNPAFGKVELVDAPQPTADSPDEKVLASFQNLHAAVGRAITLHSFVPAYNLPTKGDKLDWTMGPIAHELRSKTKARYALMIHIEDSYASAGRVALIVTSALLFGVAPPGGTQVGFASLVDLESGNIVWFNRVARGAGDLRKPESVQESIDALFLGFPLGKV